MKGGTTALKAVLISDLFKTSLLSPKQQEKLTEHLKLLAFKHICLPEYCHWMRGSKTTDTFTLQAFSKNSSILYQSYSSNSHFVLDFVYKKGIFRYWLCLLYNPNSLIKLKKISKSPQDLQLQIFTVSTLYQVQHSSSGKQILFWIKCKNNRFTEMISNLLGLLLFCQEIIPRK